MEIQKILLGINTFFFLFLGGTLMSQGTDNCDHSGGANEVFDGITFNADNTGSSDGTIWFHYQVPNDAMVHDITIMVTGMLLATPSIYQYNGTDTDLNLDYCENYSAAGMSPITITGLCPGAILVFEVGDNTPTFGTFDIDLSDASTGSIPAPTLVSSETSGLMNNDAIVCENDNFDLIENSGTGIEWDWEDPAGNIMMATGSNMINVSMAGVGDAGTYTVTVYDGNGCTNTAQIMMTVNALPSTSIIETDMSGLANDDMIVCEGDDFTLTESGGAAIEWDWEDPAGNVMMATGSNTFNITMATIPDAGTYTVTVYDANGCTNSSQLTMTVNMTPSSNIVETDMSGIANDDMIVCEGDAFTLTESGGAAVEWDWEDPAGNIMMATGSNIFNIPMAGIGDAGTYTVTVYDAGGCTNTSQISMTINMAPSASLTETDMSGIANDDMIVCEGDDFTLTENEPGSSDWDWEDPAGNITTATGSNIFNVTMAGIGDAGTYTVTVYDANGCTNSAQIAITVNLAPMTSIVETDISGNPDDQIVCTGGDFTLTESGGAAIEWDWEDPAGNIMMATGSNIFNITMAGAGDAGLYTVTVYDANGCTNTSQISMTVNPTPTATLTESDMSGLFNDDMIVCEGDDFTLTENDINNVEWDWEDPAGNIMMATGSNTFSLTMASLTDAGIYTVTVYDAGGCTNTAQINMSINAVPVANALIGNNPICPNEMLMLDEIGGNASSWLWTADMGAMFSNNVMQNPTATGVTDGENFTVVVTDANGCTSSSSVVAMVTAAPGNDNCGSSISLSAGVNSNLINTCASTDPLGNCGSPQDESTVWYSYNLVTAVGSLTFDLGARTIVGPGMVVYDGCNGTNLGEDCTGTQVVINCPLPGIYIIQVGSAAANTGDFDITVTENASMAANDECTGSIDITPLASCVYETVNGDNIGACPEIFTNCAADMNPVVWYSFTTGLNTSSVDFNNFGSTETLIVTDACPPTAATCITTAPTNFAVNSSTTYYVAGHLGSGLEGAIVFDIRFNETVQNDDPCTGTIIVGNATMQDNTCATTDIAFCSPDDENSLYYQYTMSANGNLSIIVTGLPNVSMAIFDMPPCGSAPSSTACGLDRTTLQCLSMGDIIYVAVGTSSTNSGVFDITFNESPPGGGMAPANDDCVNAIDITPTMTCVFENVTGDNTNGCPESFINCDASTFPTIWYSFTTGATTSSVDFDNFGSVEQLVVVDACNPTVATCFTGTPANFIPAPNTTYYVAVNLAGGASGGISFDIRFNQGPPNENSCGAYDITGGPQNGLTCCAGGGDWLFSGCAAGDEAANWFVYMPSPGADGVTITVTNGSLSGNVGVEIFEGDCMTMTSLGASSCGGIAGTVTLDASCLSGMNLYVKVGSTSAGCGTFTVSATETSVSCNDNDDCSTIGAAEMLAPATNSGPACASACTTSACDDSCGNNSVWFQLMTDIDASVLQVMVNNAGFTPSIGIYAGSCGALTTIFPCTTGDVALTAVVSNFTYYIEVGVASGTPGTFDLCVETFQNVVDCAISATLTPTRPEYPAEDPNGPYCPGEKVNFCYSVLFNIDPIGVGNNCQWLQGIIPTFGGGWDILTCPPWNSGPAGAAFFPEGAVNYNVNNPILGTIATPHGLGLQFGGGGLTPGTPLPQGWWFTSSGGAGCANNGNPNTMWGLPGSCGGSSSVNFCFDLLVDEILSPAECNDPVESDLSVSMFTFADGETGCWSSAVCGLDIPALFDGPLDCSSQTMVLANDDQICSGDFINVVVMPADGVSDVLIEVIDNPNVTGETTMITFAGGGGGVLADQLFNLGTNIEIVTYQMWALTPGSVCRGPLKEVFVTVYPDVLVEFFEPYNVCFNDAFEVVPQVSGGDGGPYTYSWSDGSNGSSIWVPAYPGLDPPGTYIVSVTVTDMFGCEGTNMFEYEIIEPIVLSIDPDPVLICQDGIADNVELSAVFMDLGTGPYIYQWYPQGLNTGSTSAATLSINEEASATGMYNVGLTIIDAFGCEYNAMSVVTIDSGEDVFAMLDYCDNTTYTFTGSTNIGVSVDLSVYDSYGFLINGPIFSSSITTTAFVPGIYTILSTNPSTGCSKSIEFEIFPPIEPLFDIQPEGPYCQGSSIDLQVLNFNDLLNVDWFIDNDPPVNGPSVTVPNVQSDINVYVETYDQNFCFTFNSFIIEVIDVPVVNIAGSLTFCPGSTTTLSVDSLDGYSIYWTSPSGTNYTTSSIVVNEEGFWNVEVTNQEGCTSSDSAILTQDSELTPQLVADTLCTGDTIIINAGLGFETYQWFDSAGILPFDTTHLLQVDSGGFFTVEVTNGMCSGNATIEILEFEAPDAGEDIYTFICNADTGNGPDSIDLYALIDTAQVSGFWIDNLGLSQSTVYFTGDVAGSVDSFYFITDFSQGSCVNDTLLLEVEIEDCQCPLINIGSPPDFCASLDTFNLNLINFNSDPGIWSVIENGPNILEDTLLTIDDLTPNGIYQLVYTLVQPGGGLCEAGDTSLFNIFTEPEVDLIPLSSVCNIDVGLGADSLDLDDIVILGSGSWTTNTGLQIDPVTNVVNFDGSNPGTYLFTYNTNNAISPCNNIFVTIEIEVLDCSCAELLISSFPDLCNSGGNITLSDSLSNPQNLNGTWSSDPPTAGLTGNIFNSVGIAEGVYDITFTLMDSQGGSCIDETSETITVYEAAFAVIFQDSTVCNSTTTGTFPTEVDLQGMIMSGDLNGNWVAPLNFNGGVIDNINQLDFIGINPGSYVFTYNLTGTAPCSDQSYDLIFTVENCDCPLLQFNAIPELCNDDSILDLNILLASATNPDEGEWIFKDGPEMIALQGSTFDASGVSLGVYTFTFIYNSVPLGCEDSMDLSITVNEPPNVSITQTVNLCNTSSIQAPTSIDLNTLVTGASGTWIAPSNYNSGIIIDTSNVDFDGLPIGDYTFIFSTTDANPPCVDRAYDVVITVNDCSCQLINFLAIPDLCNDNSTIDLNSLLDVPDSSEGSWNFESGPQNVALNGSIFDAIGLQAGAYDFAFYLTNVGPGCPESNGLSITVNPAPQAQVVNSLDVCNITSILGPTSINLNDQVTGDTGNWTVTSNYNGGVISDINNVDFTGLNIGDNFTFTYTTNIAIDPCEDLAQDLIITVINCECPNLLISDPSPVCNEGGVIDLSDLETNGIVSGSWSVSGPQSVTLNGNVLDYTGIMAGDYTLTFTPSIAPAMDCPQFSTTILTVHNLQSIGIPTDFAVCQGEGILVDLLNLILGSDNGGIWIENSPIPSTNNAFDASSGTFNTSGQLAGLYNFTYAFDNSNNSCPDISETVQIVIETVPVADAGPDFTRNCEETGTTLGGSLTSMGSDIIYSWIELGGININNSDQANIMANSNGTYVLTVENITNGCFDSDTVVIATDPNSLSFTATALGSPCFGANAGSIIIDDINGETPPVMASINGGISFIEITEGMLFDSLSPGEYLVILEDGIKCRAESSLIIVEPDDWSVNSGNDLEVLIGDLYDLNFTQSISQDQISNIIWTANGEVICEGVPSDCEDLSVTVTEETEFCVFATDFNGCLAVDCVLLGTRAIKKIYIPNIFSPNNDGNNDTFWIQTDQELDMLEIFVYDRWGEEIFANKNADVTDPGSFWDGRINDSIGEAGVYVYLVKYRYSGGNENNVEVIAGDITLIK